jgi:formylglycine-generating enzyme required for sulfatase activity
MAHLNSLTALLTRTFTRSTPTPRRSTALARSATMVAGALIAMAMTFGFSPSTAQAQGSCASDVNGDGVVNGGDIGAVLSDWGGTCLRTVTSVTPVHGSTLGGTEITITGTNLSGTLAVQIGGVACTNLLVSSTLVKAVTPAGAAGAGAITVINAGGGTATAPSPYTYVQQLITSVYPPAGIFSGGTAITITGAFLNGATSVRVGGVACTNVVAVNSTTVTAVTPAGSVGSTSVEVTSPKGTATAANAFTYTSTWYLILEQNPNPAVVTDVTLRNAITATGYPWRVRDNWTQIEMVLVPGGTFTMGCTASNANVCNDDESPTHSVTITNAFYMGRYEVTQAQWQATMGSNPSAFQGASYPNAASHPVEQVSWNTVQGFLTATGMQLPTEAQWEYACRAGTTTAFHGFTPNWVAGTNDQTLVGNIAWYDGNNGASGSPTYGTKPVGGKAANGLGLHDMSGNVWEWCRDWYGAYSAGAQTNPTGPATGNRVMIRGGSWNLNTNLVRSSVRKFDFPATPYLSIGFRVARPPS